MKNLKKTLLIATLFVVQSGSGIGYSQERQLLKTGIFSTLHVSPQSGDIGGMELNVVPGANGYVVVAQGTEGAPGTPVVFPLSISGANVEFQVPASCPCALIEGRYRASLDDDGLTLSRSGASNDAFLPRSESFWQTYWRE